MRNPFAFRDESQDNTNWEVHIRNWTTELIGAQNFQASASVIPYPSIPCLFPEFLGKETVIEKAKKGPCASSLANPIRNGSLNTYWRVRKSPKSEIYSVLACAIAIPREPTTPQSAIYNILPDRIHTLGLKYSHDYFPDALTQLPTFDRPAMDDLPLNRQQIVNMQIQYILGHVLPNNSRD